MHRNSKQKGRIEFVISHKSEQQNLKTELLRLLPTLSKNQIEELRSIVYQHYVKRFRRSRIPKYGNLNKGFTEYEIQKFFKVIDNDKFRILFYYQAQLGLRIGEVLAINMIYISTKKEELYKELDNIDMDSAERLKRSVINMERNST